MVKLQLKKFAGLLWRPESPELLISPKEIISLSKGRPDGLVRMTCAAADGREWAGAMACLTEWCGKQKAAKGRTVEPVIVISNHWVRYVVLPADRGNLRRTEEVEFARAMVAERNGPEWESSTIRLSRGVSDEGIIAAAIPDALLADISAVLSASGLRCNAIHPLFSHTLDHARFPGCKNHALIACVEPGRMVIGMVGNDGWSWVQSPLSGLKPAVTLERELSREQSLFAVAGEMPLYLFEHGASVDQAIDPALQVVIHRLH
jgi:hypothetical protein